MQIENEHQYGIRDFINEPYSATWHGYQPNYLDLVSMFSSSFSFGIFSDMYHSFKDLFHKSVIDFPIEFIKWMFVMFLILTIPLGMNFVMAFISWHLTYKPSVLQPTIEKSKANLKRRLGY